MANEQQITNLKQVVAGLKSVDRKKLLRPELGQLSLKEKMESNLETLDKRIDLLLQTASSIPGNIVENLTSTLSSIYQYMNNQCAIEEAATYAAEQQNFLNNFQAQFEAISSIWPNVIAAAVEARGFLEDGGIKKEFAQAIESMKRESENNLAKVKEESEKVIEEARTLAEDIENRARRTASGISVEGAQEQFRLAQEDHDKQVKFWACFSGGSISLFIGAASAFWYLGLPEGDTKAMLYLSAIRVTILGALGVIFAFCTRMLRAHMHMAQHNRHRQRIANSIAAFVESAVTPEQRDLILAHLVDSIAHFGSSGILRKEDESAHTSKLVVDNLSRTIGPQQTSLQK